MSVLDNVMLIFIGFKQAYNWSALRVVPGSADRLDYLSKIRVRIIESVFDHNSAFLINDKRKPPAHTGGW